MEDKLVQITLTVSEWNLILQAIQELPAKVANPLNNKIVEQAKVQLETKEELME